MAGLEWKIPWKLGWELGATPISGNANLLVPSIYQFERPADCESRNTQYSASLGAPVWSIQQDFSGYIRYVSRDIFPRSMCGRFIPWFTYIFVPFWWCRYKLLHGASGFGCCPFRFFLVAWPRKGRVSEHDGWGQVTKFVQIKMKDRWGQHGQHGQHDQPPRCFHSCSPSSLERIAC